MDQPGSASRPSEEITVRSWQKDSIPYLEDRLRSFALHRKIRVLLNRGFDMASSWRDGVYEVGSRLLDTPFSTVQSATQRNGGHARQPLHYTCVLFSLFDVHYFRRRARA